MVNFVNQASRDGRAEGHWLTTWTQDARSNLAPDLGFDEFFTYDMPDDSPGWWKEFVVADLIATNDLPFIRTDDDLDEEDVLFLAGVKINHLALCPAMTTGLSDQDPAAGQCVINPPPSS